MGKYIILPGCDDGNRGDQALVWETKRRAEQAGFCGQYRILGDREDVLQSVSEGFEYLRPILGHPGRYFKNDDNTKYSKSIIIRWGMVASVDFVFSIALKNRIIRYIIKPFLPSAIKNVVNEFETCDACFVKGGGFIHSYGSFTDCYLFYYYLYHIRLAQSMGKPVYVMPNSFGPFIAPTVKGQVIRAFRGCKCVMSRESISNKQISDVGVKNVLDYPDLAFGLKKSDREIPEMEDIKEAAAGKKMVAITVRPHRFPDCSDPDNRYQQYITSITRFCKWLFQNGFFPILTEHVISKSKNESDISCIDLIKADLDEEQYAIFANAQYSCRELKKFYSSMYAVVGTRFHSVIFSLSEYIPCIAITYGGNKGQGIMKDLSLEEYSMEISAVSLEKLIETFELLNRNYANYKTVLLNSVTDIHDKLDDLSMLLRSYDD